MFAQGVDLQKAQAVFNKQLKAKSGTSAHSPSVDTSVTGVRKALGGKTSSHRWEGKICILGWFIAPSLGRLTF